MNYIIEYNKFDPVLNNQVKDFVSRNKYHLPELWDKDLSEEENVNFMIKFFKEYPDQMKSSLNIDKIRKVIRGNNNFANRAPMLQKNIGISKSQKAFSK